MPNSKKFLKIETEFSTEDIDAMYRTCSLHSDLEGDFGMFCLGAAMVLRSIFKKFQIEGCYTRINILTQPTVVTTMTLLEGLDGARRDLMIAEGDGVLNRALSEQMKIAAKVLRQKMDEKEEDKKL